jgi:hypothetical protein
MPPAHDPPPEPSQPSPATPPPSPAQPPLHDPPVYPEHNVGWREWAPSEPAPQVGEILFDENLVPG